jgi:hypothetical protein
LLGEEVATALKGISEPSETAKNDKNVDTIQQLKLKSHEKENTMQLQNLSNTENLTCKVLHRDLSVFPP